MRDIRMNLLEEAIEYRIGIRKYSLAYSDIAEVYSKLQEVHTKVGCGAISYNVEFLYIKTKNDELIKLETSSPEKAKEILAFLNEKLTLLKK